MGDPVSEAHGPELSAIVLCYRAEESILLVLEPLYELLEQEGISFELILVANQWPHGGDERTAAVVDEFARSHAHVRPVVREKQGAMGWDMRSGFEATRGRYMIVIDGDTQNPVSDVVEMYRRMRESNADVMKGRRTSRGDGVYRRIISVVYNLLFRLLFGTKVWDVNGKPKGLSRQAYEQFDLRSDDWFIDAEIVLEAKRNGLPVAELPVLFHRNDERASFVRVSAIWEFLTHMIRYRLRGTL